MFASKYIVRERERSTLCTRRPWFTCVLNNIYTATSMWTDRNDRVWCTCVCVFVVAVWVIFEIWCVCVFCVVRYISKYRALSHICIVLRRHIPPWALPTYPHTHTHIIEKAHHLIIMTPTMCLATFWAYLEGTSLACNSHHITSHSMLWHNTSNTLR